MPNIKSAKKRVLVSKVNNARNKMEKSALKTTLKKFDAAVADGNREQADSAYKAAVKTNLKKFDAAVVSGDKAAADAAYKTAVKAVDQAVNKGILHKNNAARKKSSITLKMNELA